MYIRYLVLLLFMAVYNLTWAQNATNSSSYLRNIYLFPKERYLRLNLEFSVSGGAAFALGQSAQTGRDVNKNGYARQGYGLEFSAAHRFRKNALFSLQFNFGYARQPFGADTAALTNPDLSQRYAVAGEAWQNAYFVPALAFRAGRKLLLEATFGLGGTFLQGGVSERQQWQQVEQNWQFLQESWQPSPQIALGFRTSLALGYAFKIGDSRRISLALQATYMQFGGSRLRTLREQNYAWNSQNNSRDILLSDANFSIQQDFRSQLLQLNLLVRYNLYKTLYPHTRTKSGIIYH